MAEKQSTHRSGLPDTSWRSSGFAAKPRGRADYRGLTIFLVGALVTLVSLVIVWFRYLGPVPADADYVAISIGRYDEPDLPVVPFARQGNERIKRHFPKTQRDAEARQATLLTHELKRLEKQPAHRPVVVHITGLAMVRGGKVYLLPIEARIDNKDQWVPVDTILDAVGRCPAPRLLILDLAHSLADPRLGVLVERVAETLESQLKNSAPKYGVLCSCAAGQISLVSPVLQSSVFNYYLDQGLAGKADGWGPAGVVDDRISVHELCAFVENRVQHWASANGQAQQTPLWFKGKDFNMVNLAPDSLPLEDALPPRAWPQQLKDGWRDQQNWLKLRQEVGRDVFLRRQRELLRQEQRWQGGESPNFRDLPSFAAEQRQALPALSVALACRPVKDNAKLLKAVRDLLAQPDKADAKAIDAKFKEVDYPHKAWAVLEALAGVENWQVEQVRLACELLDQKALDPRQPYVETCYLQEFKTYAGRLKPSQARPEEWGWYGDYVAQVFKTMRAREAVIVALSETPALLPWVDKRLAMADVIRRAQEVKFLWGDAHHWTKEIKTRLQEAETVYLDAARDLEKLSQCRQVLDDALARLPGWACMVASWPEPDAEAVKAWQSAVLDTQALTALLARKDAQLVPAIKADELGKSMQALKRILHDRRERALKGTRPETVDRMAALLKCPLLECEERGKLLEKSMQLAADLQKDMDRDGETSWPAGKKSVPKASGGKQQDQAMLRALVACDLLELQGTPVKTLEKLRQSLKKMSDVDTLELALRAALKQQPPPPQKDDAWRDFCNWLARNYVAEGAHWSSQTKERPEIAAFFESRSVQLRGPGP